MRLGKIFSSNMVFPARKTILVYGTGKGNAKIIFNNIERTVNSDNDNWITEFPAMEYGGPYKLEFKCENDNITLDNIYVGEVFLMAGQSNMEFKLKDSSTSENEYVSNSKLRLFSTDQIEGIKVDYFNSNFGWVICDKKTAGEWSALAYHVGNIISNDKNIVVGVISCYRGASVIESWLPKGTLDKAGINIPLEYKTIDHKKPNYLLWNKDGTLYDFAVSQVKPYSISAIVWYQGESDTSKEEAKLYKRELAILINILRRDFNDEKLPFVVSQIADFEGEKGEGWKGIQQAQYEIQYEVENVKTVITKDVCETDDVHPKTKDKLAKRIASALIEFIDMCI